MTKLADYADKYTGIRFTRSGTGVLEMTLHTRGGPAKWGTSLTSLHAELGDAFLDIGRDPENKVVILTGTGDQFLTEFDREDWFQEATHAEMSTRIHMEGIALLNNLLAVPVPMIAAVNGPAHIHAELAVLCDVVLAVSHAEFADLAHMVNGAVPGDGVHVVWPMLLGPNRGRSFLLTGERIGAEEAKRLGIVSEVTAPENLLDRAHAVAANLARWPVATLRHTRAVLAHDLRRRMHDELPSGLAHEAMAMLANVHY